LFDTLQWQKYIHRVGQQDTTTFSTMTIQLNKNGK